MKLWILLGLAVNAWAGTVLTIEPSFFSVHPGETFTVTARLTTDIPVVAYQFDLLFPNIVNVEEDPRQAGFFESNGCCFGWLAIENSTGVISTLFDAAVGPDSFTGTDILFTVLLKANSVGYGDLTFQNVLFTDDNWNAISDVTIVPATILSITSPLPNPSVPEPGTSCLLALGGAVLAWRGRKSTR